VDFHLFRPRTGDKTRSWKEIADLTARASHEQELFSPPDWELIQWLADTYVDREGGPTPWFLTGTGSVAMAARWGDHGRLELKGIICLSIFRGT